MSWVPLHVHSQYSILDSTASVEALAARAKRDGLKALALTDAGNLYGAVDFYKACKAEGVKPILGCELWLAPGARTEKKKIPDMQNGYPLVLLAKNQEGYRNLCKLSSIAFLEGFYYQPRIDREVLARHAQGLICLSGPLSGWIPQLIAQGKEVREEVAWFQRLFGDDFYFELQRHPACDEALQQESWLLQRHREYVELQEKVNQQLVRLGQECGVRCVATQDIHYIERDDWRAHEILLNIMSGEPVEMWERDSRGMPKNRTPNPKRDTLPTHELYFKSPAEMAALFRDLPEALEESVRIAEKCHVELDFKARHYPVFVPPALEGKSYSVEERRVAAEEYLRELCLQGIERRYTAERLACVAVKYPGRDPKEVVRDRFEYEYKILTSKGMSDYMLIVYDFIAWAKRNRIPMGPGRGSAAGSIIAYAMGITDIEPLRFHLFFERFINPERVSYPDIDVDICMDRRQEVIEYVIQRYGKDRVAQIITFGTMKAKMAIRDVGRVLNVPLPKVNQIAALVPEDPTMTLEKAFEIDPELTRLMQSDEEARRVLEMAKRCEGSIRNTSIHAAGMIISGPPITDLIPVCTAKDSDMVVTQYSMKPVESVGMLKIDFLGLKTLTAIQVCADAIAASGGPQIDWANLPLDNQAAYDLLNQGDTLGVFQLESGGMQDLAKQLHIDLFEEIIAVGALYRPGPMDMIPSFINRKHGREAIEIDHPLLQEILSETYGVMVYQEQVMQIASTLAGYTLGEGDVLRRAMGKKDREEMNRQRDKFLRGAEEKGISRDTARVIFDKIEKFASYGFNKSHAAAYAYLSYATAFFKANYPREWMAALMTCDRDDISKVSKFIREAKSMGIALLPPDINQARRDFTATPEGIRFALNGIKGVGESVVDAILEERKRAGPFASLYDLIQRVDKTRVTKKSLEILVDAGTFDFTTWTRDALRASIEEMYDSATKSAKMAARGEMLLFSLDTDLAQGPPPVLHPTPKMQLLQRERELLGFYLTGHPMDAYQEALQKLKCVPLRELETVAEGSAARIAFIVETLQVKISSKTQRKFAILAISDGIDRFELPIWADLYEQKNAILRENQLLYAVVQVEIREGARSLQCRFLGDLTAVDDDQLAECEAAFDRVKSAVKRERRQEAKKETAAPEAPIRRLRLTADADQLRHSHLLALKEMFRAHPGPSPVEIRFMAHGQMVGTLEIAANWGITLDRHFHDRFLPFATRLALKWEVT